MNVAICSGTQTILLLLTFFADAIARKNRKPEPEPLFTESDYRWTAKATGYPFAATLAVLALVAFLSDIPKFREDFLRHMVRNIKSRFC